MCWGFGSLLVWIKFLVELLGKSWNRLEALVQEAAELLQRLPPATKARQFFG